MERAREFKSLANIFLIYGLVTCNDNVTETDQS